MAKNRVKDQQTQVKDVLFFYMWELNLDQHQTTKKDLNRAGFKDLRAAVNFWELNHDAFVNEFKDKGNVLENIESSIHNCKEFLRVGPARFKEMQDEFMEDLIADL